MSLVDLIFIIPILFVTVLGLFLAVYVSNILLPSVKEIVTSTAADSIIDSTDYASNVWDFVFLSAVIGSTIGIVVLGAVSGGNNILFFAGLVVYIVCLLIAPVFANSFNDFASLDNISAGDFENTMPMSIAIMQNYPMWVLFIGAMTMIALYARSRGRSLGE